MAITKYLTSDFNFYFYNPFVFLLFTSIFDIRYSLFLIPHSIDVTSDFNFYFYTPFDFLLHTSLFAIRYSIFAIRYSIIPVIPISLYSCNYSQRSTTSILKQHRQGYYIYMSHRQFIQVSYIFKSRDIFSQ